MLHYFTVKKDTTFCGRVIYKDWYKAKYQTLLKAFGQNEPFFPRQPHECQQCYDAVLELKRNTFTQEKVSGNSRQSIDADSVSDVGDNGAEDS